MRQSVWIMSLGLLIGLGCSNDGRTRLVFDAAVDVPFADTSPTDAMPDTPVRDARPDSSRPDAPDPMDGGIEATVDAPDGDGDADLGCADMDLGSALGEAVSTGLNLGAGDNIVPSCGAEGGEDMVFLFTAPATAQYTIDTLGSDYDTVLTVSDPTCTMDLECSDDGFETNRLSAVRVSLVAGERVAIVVDAFEAAETGTYVLNIFENVPETETMCTGGIDDDRDDLTDCDDLDCRAQSICDNCGMIGITTLAAGAEATGMNSIEIDNRAVDGCGTGLGGRDASVLFTAPSAGFYRFDTSASDYDTVVYLLSGGCMGTELACNDDSAFGIAQSVLVHHLAMGEVVAVIVDAFAAADTGTWSLDITSVTAPPAATQAGDVWINEIMQNPDVISDTMGEYFEVTGRRGPITLEGCTISDDGSDNVTVIGSPIIHFGQTVVFARDGAAGFPIDHIYGSGFILGNADDEVVITCGATEIDRVNYDGGPTFPHPTGRSMQFDPLKIDLQLGGMPPHIANDTATNWCATPTPAASTYDGTNIGTPGQSNVACPP